MRRAGIVVMALTLLLWSVATAAIDLLLATPYREIATPLETGRATAPDAAFHADVEESLGGDGVVSLCDRNIVRSSVSIALASVETAYRLKVPPAEINAALERARSTLVRAIRCRPRDGNFWLRLAIVDHAANGKIESVDTPLLKSFALAPSEAWIVMARIAFVANLGAGASPRVLETLRTDARNLLRYARPSQIADFFISADESARHALEGELATVSDDRRAELKQAIDWANAQATRK